MNSKSLVFLQIFRYYETVEELNHNQTIKAETHHHQRFIGLKPKSSKSKFS